MSAIPRATYNPSLDERKLDQAILFFLDRAANQNLGKTKLMKLLYFADFDHFEQYDTPITGARYRKLPHGPVPDDAWAALDKLERSGRISCTKASRGVYVQHRAERSEDLDLSVFSETELEVLSRVASKWLDHNAAQISDAAHAEPPWIAVKFNEEIPYYLAYYRNQFGEMSLDEEELVEDFDDEEEAVVG